VVGVGGDDGEAEQKVGPGQPFGRLELGAVDGCRLVQLRRREVRGEGEGQAQHRRQLGAEGARSQDPHFHLSPGPWHRAHHLAFPGRGQEAQQLDHVAGEAFRSAGQMAAERAGGHGVGSRRPAKTQIDTAGIERRQGAELLGDDQRRVVGQHHPAGADADGAGAWATYDVARGDQGRRP
jgi:hypothetical protein